MIAAIRMEVMTPSLDSPDEGCIGLFVCLHLYLIISFYVCGFVTVRLLLLSC